MGRGRQGQPIDPDICEVSADGEKYRCIACKDHSGRSSVRWIKQKSWKKHLTGDEHKRCVLVRLTKTTGSSATNAEAAVPEPEPQYLDLGPPPAHADPEPTDPDSQKPPPMSFGEREMWFEYDGGQCAFEMDDPEMLQRAKLIDFERRVAENNLWAGAAETVQDVLDLSNPDTFLEGDELSELLDAIGMSEEEGLANLHHETEPNKDTSWAPYPSKIAFLLDALDNMSRLRVSVGLMNVIIWLLREAGVKDVPTPSSFRSLQKSLRDKKGVSTIHTKSPKGNLFSFNNPVDIIANDWANPNVQRHIHRYPGFSENGVVSEIWHGEKWRRQLDRHALSPMFDAKDRHYYIDEPARMSDGQIVIPIRWLEDDKGVVWLEAWKVVFGEDNRATIIDVEDQVVILAAEMLQHNMLDLEDLGQVPLWSQRTIEAGHPQRMPNPDRALAEGEPIYTSFIDVFGDDVSGNRSKSWNKHWNIYITHRNLPRKMLQKESHIHFISTSPNATISEQFHAIKEKIESTHSKPARVLDPVTGQYTRFKLQCNCEPGDNPAQSEAAAHMGVGSNLMCRKCEVGGTKKDKRSEGGFGKLFEPGTPRTAAGTRKEVEHQVQLACRGVAVRVSERQTETGIKDVYAQFWVERLIDWSRERQNRKNPQSMEEIEAELMGFVNSHRDRIYNPFLTLKYHDVNQDTPLEILHTILLGVVKYSWHSTHTGWKDPQKALYAARLGSTYTKGLSIPAIRAGYIMQYANSLIGRQLKILVQTNVFFVHDLVSADLYQLIKAIGVLSALLWVPEIRQMDEYLADVEIAVANVLDSAAKLDPSKIIAKMKYHLLVHAPDDIRRFGPLIGAATEPHESFNLVFRYCSILSNHHSPSRDIAYQLARQESFKHIVSGGWCKQPDGTWAEPGKSLQDYLSKSEMLQRLYHIMPSPDKANGTVGTTVLLPIPRKDEQGRTISPVPMREMYSLDETAARDATASNSRVTGHSQNKWYRCKSIVASSGDECRVGSWVFARRTSDEGSETLTGRIIEILRPTPPVLSSALAFAVVERFQISQNKHSVYDMPVLTKPLNETRKYEIPAKDILFDYNVQHDCHKEKCSVSERPMEQERAVSGRTAKYIQHDESIERFVLNTHAFHNAHLLRSMAGLGDLLRPVPFYSDRKALHQQAASTLRATKAAAEAQKNASLEPAAPVAKPAKKRKRGAEPLQNMDIIAPPNFNDGAPMVL